MTEGVVPAATSRDLTLLTRKSSEGPKSQRYSGSYDANSSNMPSGAHETPANAAQPLQAARQGADEASTDQDSKSSGSREAQASEATDPEMQAGDDRLVHFVRSFMDPTVARRFLRLANGKLEYAPRQRIQSLQDVQGLSLLELLSADMTGVRGLGGPMSSAPTDTDGDSHSADSFSSPSSNSSNSQQTSPNFDGSQHQRGNRNGQNDESNGASNPTEDVSTESRSAAQRTRLRCPFHAFFPDVYCASHNTKFRSCQGPGWVSMQYLK
jgi:hypothetical protein